MQVAETEMMSYINEGEFSGEHCRAKYIIDDLDSVMVKLNRDNTRLGSDWHKFPRDAVFIVIADAEEPDDEDECD